MNEKTTFCPNCGTKVQIGDVFCPNCGYNLSDFNKKYNEILKDSDAAKSTAAKPSPASPAAQANAQSMSKDTNATDLEDDSNEPVHDQTEPKDSAQNDADEKASDNNESNQSADQAPEKNQNSTNTEEQAPKVNNQQAVPNQQTQLDQNQNNAQQPQSGVNNFNQNNPNEQGFNPDQAVQQNQANNVAKKPKKKKKHHRGLITLFILIIALVGAYFGGTQYYSRPRQVDMLANNLSSGDTEKMASVAVDENGNQLNSSDLEPLSALYLQDNNNKDQIKRIVQNGNGDVKAASDDDQSSTNFEVVQTGKFLGIYPKYRVQIKKQEIKISTNAKNPAIKVNGKSASATNKGGKYIIDDQYPGVYTIQINGSGKKATKKVVVPLAGDPEFKTINVKKDKKKKESTKTKIIYRDTDSDDDDYDSSSDYDDDDDYDDDSDSVSGSDLVGKWSNDDNDATFTFYDDGTYDRDDGDGSDIKSGTYTVTKVSGNTVHVNFKDGSGPGNNDSFVIDGDTMREGNQGINWTRY